MEIKVKNLYCKGSTRKVRPLLHIIKGKNAEEAEVKFRFVKSNGSEIWKLLKNGISIARQNDLEPNKLYVKSLRCEKSKENKRHRYESKGRVTRIVKHRHNLYLVLTDQLNDRKSLKNSNYKKDK